MSRHFYLILIFLFSFTAVNAQDDLLQMLEEQEEEPINYTIATFKTTRIINGHSIETPHAGVLQFIISHRFRELSNEPLYNFFGLDGANIRLGLTYGLTENLALGVGRSNLDKTYDGYIKYKLLKQSSGAKNFPFTLTLFSSMAIKTLKWDDPNRENFSTSRYFYTFQAMIARKFNENLSIQLTPTLIHRNLVPTKADKNDVIALGIGARQKLTGSVSLNVEYYYVLPDQIVTGERTNSLSVGFDIETGGHVFQLHFTNSIGLIEKAFITETTGAWDDGDIHFGFNISRVFTVADKRKNK